MIINRFNLYQIIAVYPINLYYKHLFFFFFLLKAPNNILLFAFFHKNYCVFIKRSLKKFSKTFIHCSRNLNRYPEKWHFLIPRSFYRMTFFARQRTKYFPRFELRCEIGFLFFSSSGIRETGRTTANAGKYFPFLRFLFICSFVPQF